MSRLRNALTAALAALLAAAAIGAVAILGAGVYELHAALADPAEIARTVSDALVDSAVEAGVGVAPLDTRDPLLARRTLVVTAGINERTAKSVVEGLLFLDAQDPRAPIDLYLSTQGGWLDSAFAIIDAMREIRAPVNTVAIGGCYSAGLLILAAGTGERVATENSLLSLHADFGSEDEGPYGSAEAERKRVEHLLRERTRLPESWFPLENDRQFYLTPEQALEFGIVDAIRRPARSQPLAR
jgi:ATP-dependent Clp protease protease subunit